MREIGDDARSVFRKEGSVWTVAFAGRVCHLPDAKGLHYLAHLLRHPGVALPAVELLAITPPRGCGGDGSRRDPRERARVIVTKCIAAALRKLHALHPELGRHLEATIRRGYVCRYVPDPRAPIFWEE